LGGFDRQQERLVIRSLEALPYLYSVSLGLSIFIPEKEMVHPAQVHLEFVVRITQGSPLL
jgi:hypothetical protein